MDSLNWEMSFEKPESKFSTLLVLIFAGESIFFLPFVLARIFRPTLLDHFGITNLELGSYFSIYGLVAMASYFFGGPLADRFHARVLMAIALWLTALGGFAMAWVNTPVVLHFLYAFWGLSTIFLFWAAMIRATREWGGVSFQGIAFGFLEGGRGMMAALLGTFSLLIFSIITTAEIDFMGLGENDNSFMWVILMTSILVFVSGCLVWFFVPKSKTTAAPMFGAVSFSSILEVLKNRLVWIQALIIVCAYVGYKVTDDVSLYAHEVMKFDEVKSAGLGTAVLWLRPVFAVLAGLLAHRYNGTSVLVYCFGLMVIGGSLFAAGVLDFSFVLMLIAVLSAVAGVYGIRGIYFALFEEVKINIDKTGAAVGVMSVIGFTPDVFMSPLMGFLLDNFSGETGHQYVFSVLVIFGLIGLIASLKLRKWVKNE